MKIRINLKIFVFVIIFLLTNQIKIYGVIMLFALIHELGHLMVGVILKFKPSQLNIMPYGISIAFEVECEDYNKKVKKGDVLCIKKILIACAGPLTNLLIIIINLIFNIKLFGIQREIIIYSNFLIGIFNLIPIYPLDGGRIIKEILHINIGLKKANLYINQIAKITVCILTAISSITILYIKNVAIILILTYLWYIVLMENKKYRNKQIIYQNIIN